MINRLTASFISTAESINRELRTDLDALRNRSRTLAANNDHAKRFLRLVERNVVGPAGFRLKCTATRRSGEPDVDLNRAVELAFWRWARRGMCEVSGRLSFAALQRLAASTAARDGESLIQIVRGPSARNPEHLALQFLDVARIDTQMNQEPIGDRNAIVMGIEVDRAQRPVAYYLYEHNPGDGSSTGNRIRVPAEDMLHVFLPERPEQVRGIPWMHAAMLRMHHLAGYEEAAVVAARVGAAKMGFFISPDGTAQGIGEEDQNTGEFVTDAEAGTFEAIPEGWDFKQFDPEYPHAMYAPFIKATLRGIASGLDVSYHSLASDLEGVNYSSLRTGALEERDQWMTLQAWFIEQVLEPVYREWLKAALVAGTIQIDGKPIAASEYDRLLEAASWQGRRWTWVDPLKDIQAARLAVRSGVESPQHIAAQSGVDIEDSVDEIAAFEALVKSKGVTSVSYAQSGAAAQPSEEDEKSEIVG